MNRTAKVRSRSPAGLMVAGSILAFSIVAGPSSIARAQPEPSFRASCRELRASIAKLDPEVASLVTIEVVGPLTGVQFDGALAYMTMCSPPDPQVLCVTYGTGGRAAGDVVALSGNYSQRGPDHILLDPCLHSPPGQPAHSDP